MAWQLVRTAPDPNATPFSLIDWISGYKTYISMGITAAKFWWVAIYGKPWSDQWDAAINATLAVFVGAAVRSAVKTSTAQVVGAVVNHDSPAATKTAAEVPVPPAVPPGH